MNSISVMDYYINKHIKAVEVPDDQFKILKPGDKIVYEQDDDKKKLSVGIYTGSNALTERSGFFMRKLEGSEKEFFEEKQKDALIHFPSFKKQFRKKFEGSIPVTARYQIFSRQTYFYFFSEQRYIFGDFVREFQQEVGTALFFFQIGARDMIKLSPATDDIVGCNGMHLCCKSNRPLPSVDIEDVIIQQLEGRDIERLKGRCGKLKCSIIYEVETYIQESEKFPLKGQKVEVPECDICGICTSFNINTQEVIIKTEDDSRIRISLDAIKRSLEEKKKLLDQQKDKKER